MDNSQARDSTPDLYGASEQATDREQSNPPAISEYRPESADASPNHNGQSQEGEPNGKLKDSQAALLTGPSEGSVQGSLPDVAPKRKRSHEDMGPDPGTLEAVVQCTTEPEKKRLKSTSESIDLARYANHVATGKLYNLPIPIWQRILTNVPPASLARLLRVSRPLSILLDAPGKGKLSQRSIDGHVIEAADCNAIWKGSHQVFARGLPPAMEDQKEIDLWKLVKGSHCQQCGHKKPLSTDSGATAPFQAGPGDDYTRVIWPFQVRLCGDCLRSQTRTDDDLTLSGSFPSFLKDALPFIYLSDANDYVSAARYEALPPPPGLRLVKIYFRPQVEAIKRRYDHIKEFEPATASEWVQSLEEEQLRKARDAQRWETWEQKGTLAKLNMKSGSSKGKAPKSRGALAPDVMASKTHPQPDALQRQIQSPVNHGIPPDAWSPFRVPGMPFTNNSTPSSLVSPTGIQPRGQRTFAEIQAARAARRAEIERRCLLLQPPMPLRLLEHMESFRAALQISTVMDDASWEFLRARLESERAGAQEKLSRNVVPEPLPHIDTSVPTAALLEASRAGPGTANDVPSTIYLADTESPKGELHIDDLEIDPNASKLHKRLAHFADQVTLGKWSGGRSLSKESCSQFAAEVLLQVRKNYYEEAFGGYHALDPSLPRVLLLENMRWVFDNRVKPLTEQFQKDVFLCNGCDNNAKGYGLEAVIQHYAAKHTSTLSLGNVVVHWKAEWPEKPPFHPNPMLVKALAITLSTSTQAQLPKSVSETRDIGLNGQSSNGVQPSPSPAGYYSGHVQHSGGPFPTPNFNQPGYPSQPQFTAPDLPGSIAPPPGTLQNPGVAPPVIPVYSSNGTHQPSNGGLPFQAAPTGPVMPYAPPPPAQDTGVPTADVYRKHLVEMAKLARELWFATAGVKGLPGTVRTQLIIYHACERFVKSFELQPGVTMFLDGLNHEAAMRPLRSLNGFSCKACANGLPGALPPSDRKQSTLPHLLGHFKTAHAEHHGLDWRKDMVQLPQMSTISDLVNAVGMDEGKFSLLGSAFPEAFPQPLPSLATIQRRSSAYTSGNATANQVVPQGAYQSTTSLSPTKMSGYSGILQPQLPAASRASESPGEDDYDPRRPSYIGRMVPEHHSGGRNQPSRRENVFHSVNPYEVGDADRFLDDLQPQIRGSRSEYDHHSHTTTTDTAYGRHTASYPQPADNTPAAYSNGQIAANEPRYYSETNQPSAHYQEAPPEHYITRYYEAAPRNMYKSDGETEYAYYIRQPDGRLVPANDRDTQVVYERDLPTRERSYEVVPESRNAGYYASEPVSVSHHDGPKAYTYSASAQGEYMQQPSRVVYIDRREPEQFESGASYDPKRPGDGYTREHVHTG